MTSDEHDEWVADALDRLGADAVAEADEVPPMSSGTGAPLRGAAASRWLVAAALVVVAGVGAALFLGNGHGPDDHVVADRTDEPAPEPRPAPAETGQADVTVEFRRDPDRFDDIAFIGTVRNHSDAPWSWDCAQGTLSRWDGSEWELVARSATWGAAQLALHENEAELDCGPPEDFLAPGSTDRRPMQPVWLGSVAGEGNQPLVTLGEYRLVVPGPAGTEAVGRFTIDDGDAAASAVDSPIDLSGGLELREDRPPTDTEIAGPGGMVGLVLSGGRPVHIERVVGVEGSRRLGVVLRSDCNRPPARLVIDRVGGTTRLSATATQFVTVDCVGEPDSWSVVVDVDTPLPAKVDLVSYDGTVEVVELAPSGTPERTVVLASTDGGDDVPDRLTPLAAQFWQPWGTGGPEWVDSFRTGDLCTSAATVLRFTVGEGSVDAVDARATLRPIDADGNYEACALPPPLLPADGG